MIIRLKHKELLNNEFLNILINIWECQFMRWFSLLLSFFEYEFQDVRCIYAHGF